MVNRALTTGLPLDAMPPADLPHADSSFTDLPPVWLAMGQGATLPVLSGLGVLLRGGASPGPWTGPVHVEVPPCEDPGAEAALDAALDAGAAGVWMAATHPAELTRLDARLAVREAERGLPHGSTRILALATPGLLLAAGGVVGGLGGASHRLADLAYDAALTGRALGAGPDAAVLGTTRSLARLAAAAAGLPAVLVLPGLGAPAEEVRLARREGFAAVLVGDAGRLEEVRATFHAGPAAG